MNDPKQLRCFKTGPEGAPLMFLIHGWPDNHHVWDAQVAHFSQQYQTVAVELPHYGDKLDNRWGYSFDELVEQCVWP